MAQTRLMHPPPLSDLGLTLHLLTEVHKAKSLGVCTFEFEGTGAWCIGYCQKGEEDARTSPLAPTVK